MTLTLTGGPLNGTRVEVRDTESPVTLIAQVQDGKLVPVDGLYSSAHVGRRARRGVETKVYVYSASGRYLYAGSAPRHRALSL